MLMPEFCSTNVGGHFIKRRCTVQFMELYNFVETVIRKKNGYPKFNSQALSLSRTHFENSCVLLLSVAVISKLLKHSAIVLRCVCHFRPFGPIQ